jgi:hypothetical protein
MATNYSTALGALPFLPFFFQEFLHTFFLDELQVFEHAHVILCSVTLIQAFHPLAGQYFTTNAETFFFHVIAIRDDATPTIIIISLTATWALVLPAQVALANVAVHAARRYQFSFHNS